MDLLCKLFKGNAKASLLPPKRGWDLGSPSASCSGPVSVLSPEVAPGLSSSRSKSTTVCLVLEKTHLSCILLWLPWWSPITPLGYFSQQTQHWNKAPALPDFVSQETCWKSVGEAAPFALPLLKFPDGSRQNIKSPSKILGDSSAQTSVSFWLVGPKKATRSRVKLPAGQEQRLGGLLWPICCL